MGGEHWKLYLKQCTLLSILPDERATPNDILEEQKCNDQFPQRWESPQGLADLGSAIGLAPQSLGLLGGLRDGMGVS